MQKPPAAPDASESGPAVRHRRSLPAYVGAGGIATASHYAVTIASVEFFTMPPLAASMSGFAAGAAIKYWLNYSVAFGSRSTHARAISRFTVALAVLFALNAALFALLQRGAGLHYMLAQALTTILLIAPGYVIHRQWVFR